MAVEYRGRPERQAAQGEGARGQAHGRDGRMLDRSLADGDDRPGRMRRGVPVLRRRTDRRGREHGRQRDAVPVEGARPDRLHGDVHAGPVGAPPGSLPRRRLRLERPAGRLGEPLDPLAGVRRGAGRRTARRYSRVASGTAEEVTLAEGAARDGAAPSASP